MKAKEKAKELVDSFYFKIASYPEKSICYFEYNTAKQCALICVDEMMQVIPANINPIVYMPLLSNLQEIKQEINKL